MCIPGCIKNKRGFSLLEAFIAMSILVFCVTALFVSLYLRFNLVNDVRENIVAASIIEHKIEDLRKSFFSSLPSYGETSFSDSSLSRLYNSSAKVNLSQYIDSNIVKAVVTVTWHSRLNTSKQSVKSVITLIAKNGINSI